MTNHARKSSNRRPDHARRRFMGIAAAIALAATSAHGQEVSIELRPAAAGSGPRQVTGVIESITAAGLTLRQGEGPGARRIVVSLDSIGEVPAVPPGTDPALERLAVKIWRAARRIERGDSQAAEPLFDEVAASVIPAGGPTGALVAEGLLACRLAREARAAAVFAWLDWARIVRSGPGIAGAPAGSIVAPPAVTAVSWEGGTLAYHAGASPVDLTTGLCPALPPIWLPGAATDALAASPEWTAIVSNAPDSRPGPVSELAQLYRAAAQADAGESPQLPEHTSPVGGVALVREIVAVRTSDAGSRETARAALLARIGTPDTPAWIEAWCRAGIGRSLVVEADADTRRRGVLSLLHIPARFARTQRHLAAMCLAEASVVLERNGDAASASILRSELARVFPDHPAARWAEEQRAASTGVTLNLYDALAAMAVGAAPLAQPEEIEPATLGPDDALEAYLHRLELSTLLAEHLSERLAAAPRDQRAVIADRLARLYVKLLEQATDADSRTRWEQKAQALLNEVPEAEGFELRISLSRALYTRAEDTCERRRLRLAAESEIAEAERILRQLEPQLRDISIKVHRRVDTLERIEKQGDATDELIQQLADARRVRSLAYYYAGWCSYYLAMLTESPPLAADAFKSFGWLLNSPNGRPATLDRVTPQLFRYEHVARAALGCALAASVRGNDAEAMSWIESIEESDELPDPVRAQILLRKISILGKAKRWSDLERTVRLARNSDRSGGGPNLKHLGVTEARMLAVVTLEADRTVAAPNIESLARIALGDLVAQGEVAHVLNLVDQFGTAPLGDTGFIVNYVRAVKAYDEARDAHKAVGGDPEEPAADERVITLYRTASGLLAATLGQPDAAQFKPERVRAASFAARAAFYAGDFAAAADGFYKAWELAAAESRSSPSAEEALWLAVVSLDRAAAPPGASAELATKRSATGAMFLQNYPDSERSARLLLMRAAAGDVSDDEALRVLENFPKNSSMYEASRRQLARILYSRFRAATGSERDFAAMRFITVAEELLAIDRRAASNTANRDPEAGARAIVRARQLLDALLGVTAPDADRAQSTLELIRTLAAISGAPLAEHEPELVYRELQIAIAKKQDDRAAQLAEKLTQMPGAQREFAGAADRLLFRQAVTSLRAAGDADRNHAAERAVRYGVRVLDRLGTEGESGMAKLAVQSAVGEAAYVLWTATGGSATGGGDEPMRDLSLRMDKEVLKASPSAADVLRRVTATAEAAGEERLALECWSVLLSAAASGSEQWFEARYHALRLISKLEPVRARDLLAQHRALFPNYGPAPWGERIRELEQSLPAANGKGGS